MTPRPGTPVGCRAENRRRPNGMAMPAVSPRGASSATATTTRTENGNGIMAGTDGPSQNEPNDEHDAEEAQGNEEPLLRAPPGR